MFLDITQEDRTLWLSYYNLDGKTRFKTYELDRDDMFNWQVCSTTDKNADKKFKNWDGRPVKKVKAKFLNRYRLIEYIENLPQSDKNLIFSYNFPNIYFIDIEVEVTDDFPEPTKAQNPITAICIVTPERQCIVLGTKDLDKQTQSKIQKQLENHFKDTGYDFSFMFKFFASEYDMMYTFMNSFVKRFPMMTGWNFIKFDWTYIINRCKKLGIDPGISSPLGRTFGVDSFPCHVGVMDYLDIYAKWDKNVDVKTDYKLDTVGNAVIGVNKVKYEGSIQDMYIKDYPKYILYNIIDTAIVYLIHQKIKTMNVALTIAHMSQISIFKASSPVAITESLLCREYLSRNLVMASDPASTQAKRVSYEGAFVKDPIVGMHHAVACFDFASLYPSIMRQMNVSPESFIKKVEPEKRNTEKSNNTIVSVTGAVYDKQQSILNAVLSRLYSQRREYKEKSLELQEKAYELEQLLKNS